MVALIWLAAGVAVVYLVWNLYRRFGADRLAELNERRRASSRMVGRGEFVDGNRHLDVALAVTQSTLFYENADMQASLDLDWVREIEYDTELATGGRIPNGKVLRLRSDSQVFEFVLPDDTVARWHLVLPARGPAPQMVAEASAGG
jgi:hypothetical protein